MTQSFAIVHFHLNHQTLHSKLSNIIIIIIYYWEINHLDKVLI